MRTATAIATNQLTHSLPPSLLLGMGRGGMGLLPRKQARVRGGGEREQQAAGQWAVGSGQWAVGRDQRDNNLIYVLSLSSFLWTSFLEDRARV
jgi:hypothetical protein